MAVSPKRIFISATMKDLGTYRRKAAELLTALGLEPIYQDEWPPTYKGLLDLIEEKIDSCDAVICLVGNMFGAEPTARSPHTHRLSYTQLEYHSALSR
ncbi:MAG: DUF4062 domain-containing protein [Verrucomicrobiota bacterium]